MLILLGGRALQGLGGGILFALSYALIRIVFTENLWSRAMGVVSGMWGIATLCTQPLVVFLQRVVIGAGHFEIYSL